ncbi:MAG TPA: AmmeMemoRadiSam system radical SAM enzyme [Anaerolineae bacterium]|nr:AmmeMemoRadiSam system radical SAM enzyme [Anaerolineae bacterium]
MPEKVITLAEYLDSMAVPGELYEKLDDNTVRCYACGLRCKIKDGRRGVCQVRFNKGGVLYVPFGYAAGIQADPIEKKPFFHVLPGADALTFGMLGCDMHCDYCQNWLTSQALRDPAAGTLPTPITAEEMVGLALKSGAKAVVSSYNEPLITSEWAVAVFKEARKHDLICGYVSNGNATPEVLDYLRPWAQIYKIDLKTMDDKKYRQLGAPLKNILDGIKMVYERGFWLEIVTLLVPNFNDSEEEIREAAEFIASISPDIPWHITAFHPDYKMTDRGPTQARKLLRAAEIGKEAGLHFVYLGNLPGQVAEFENTYCPHCGQLLVERTGYLITGYYLTDEGHCPKCGAQIPGVWHKRAADANVASDLTPWYARRPRVVR